MTLLLKIKNNLCLKSFHKFIVFQLILLFQLLFVTFSDITIVHALGRGVYSRRLISADPPQGELRKWLRGRSILFIGGYTGREVIRYCFRYMRDFEQEAIESFCMKTEFFGPSSFYEPEDNLESIYQVIRRFYSKTGIPIIIIAHSKGGPELLETLIKYKDLLEDEVVDYAVAFQGVFGGSFIMGDNLPWHLKHWNLSIFKDLPFVRAIHSLKTAPEGMNLVHQTLAKLIYENTHPKTQAGLEFLKNLHRRFYYVVTEASNSDLSSFSWVAQTVSRRSTLKANDGMILSAHQVVDGQVIANLLNKQAVLAKEVDMSSTYRVDTHPFLSLGTLLLRAKGDHVNLVSTFGDWTRLFSVRSFVKRRRELMMEIFRALYHRDREKIDQEERLRN